MSTGMEDNQVNCCNSEEANREGTSVFTRFLKELYPENAPIDSRKPQDILNFAKRFAELVRFYDLNEPDSSIDVKADFKNSESTKAGTPPHLTNWKEFFYTDIAVVVASISQFENKLSLIKDEYNQYRKKVVDNPGTIPLRNLYNCIINDAKRIMRWYERSIDGHPLKKELEVKIESFVSPAIKKLIAYDKGMMVNTQDDLDLITQYEAFKVATWKCDYHKIDLDSTIYVGDHLKKKIIYSLLYVDDIFNTIFKVYQDLVRRSSYYWEEAILKYPSHSPHMALFISFVKLFGHAQDQLNGLTQKHLDFFYRDVLHIKEKPAHPDSVYLIYELAKGVDDYKLEQGAELTAGKDVLGKQLIYKADEELVINKAKVKELKTVFLDKYLPDGKENKEENYKVKNMYASPVANSADGKGEKFTDAESAWSTFGYFESGKSTEEEIKKTEALKPEVGFAIASPQLFLFEGERKVTFLINGTISQDNGVTFQEVQLKLENFEVWLTGSKGWLSFYPNAVDNNQIIIPVSEKAIVAFNPELHSGNFSTDYPVAKFILRKDKILLDETSASFFDDYKTFVPNNIAINVDVTGLTNIILENDDGLINPNSPFYPFTARPVVGSSFYIGSEEFAEKEIGSLKINVDYNGQLDFDRRYIGYIDIGDPDFDESIFIDNLENNTRRDFKSYVTTLSSFKNNLWLPDGPSIQLFSNEKGTSGSWEFKNEAVLPGEGLTQLLNRVYHEKLNSNSKFSDFKRVLARLANNNIDNAIDLITVKGGIFTNPELAKETLHTLINNGENNDLKLRKIFVEPQSGKGTSTTDPFAIMPGRILPSYKIPDAVLNNNYRVFRLSLDEQDFGNEFYPTLISLFLAKRKKIVSANNGNLNEYKVGTVASGDNDVFVPSTPAEIKIKSISINYISTKSSVLEDDQFFHIYPFGETEIELKGETENDLIIDTKYLLPQFKFGELKNQYEASTLQQGNLFIGIENLVPPQNLSLLFKFANGTAFDNDSEPPKINWSYLVNNEWKPLPEDHKVHDSTYDFQTTGIILFDIPDDANNINTITSANLYWLCASIEKYGDRVPSLIDVIAQANQATFSDNENDPAHYNSPLPEKSISKSLVKIPEVKLITQPFESFDGKPREEGKIFYNRVSERLRHKGRAITPWDYEHLVLNEFPSVYKVKVLSHNDPECLCRSYIDDEDKKKCCCQQIAPGHVLVIPISNLRNKNAIDPLRPRTERRTLLKIQDFLNKRISPFVKVQAKNPKFEEVKVSFNVKLNKEADKGYYMKKLNEDIIQFLAPWRYDSNIEILFGNKIYASKIINFIEEREYVNYITCFRMIHIVEGCCADDSLPGLECPDMQDATQTQNPFINEVTASSPQAILVPAKDHCISIIEEKPITGDCNCH